MKTSISYSLIAAAMACGFANGQTTAYTTPVGYVTQTLAANQFTLVGLTTHNSAVAAGILDAESASPNTVTDNAINFTTILSVGSTYILELADGTVQEITSWSGSVLTTPDNITGVVVPGTTSYTLRKAATVAETFGLANSVGLSPDTDGSFTGTDFILILNQAGSAFITVYYFNDGAGTTGWFTEAGDPAENIPFVYPDSFFVKRAAGVTKTLVVSGEVKLKPTGGRLVAGFNYTNGVAPVGSNLGNSGLQAYLTPDTDGSFTGTDFVLIQQGVAYLTAYYFNDGAGTTGWFTEAGDPAESIALDGGFLLKSASGPKPFNVSVPSSFSNL